MEGRRFGSGFTIICEGMPPCDTIVGGCDEGAGEQTCGGPLMLDVPSGSVTKAWSRPIQWTVRRKEEDQPSGSDA